MASTSRSRSDEYRNAIEKYFENRPKLDYLCLEVKDFEKKSVKGKEFICFEKGFSHEYHGSNRQINFLVDLNYTNCHNIDTLFDRVNLLSKVCLKHFYSIDDRLEKLERNTRVLSEKLTEKKTQTLESGEWSDTLKRKIEKLPTTAQVVELIDSVIDKPKEVEAEALRLTKALDNRIDRVEALVERLNKYLI